MSLWLLLLVWVAGVVVNTPLGSASPFREENEVELREGGKLSHVLSKRHKGGDTGGAPCVFPYTYGGRSYDSCTLDGRSDNRWWCATTANYNTDGFYGYCSFNAQPTTLGNDGGTACMFPFIYNGKTYKTCTLDGRTDGRWWCAHTGNYDTDRKYGFCTTAGIVGLGSSESRATGPTPLCVFPFVYAKLSYNGCTQAGRDDGRWWCSTTANYDDDRRWAYCSNKAMMTSGGNGGSANCMFPFLYGDKPVYECTLKGRTDTHLWCATTANYNTDKKYGFCGRAGGYSEEPSCIFPFVYKGQSYSGCTQDGRTDGKWWCSTTANYDSDKKWIVCPVAVFIVPAVAPTATVQPKVVVPAAAGNREADFVFVVDGSAGVSAANFALLRQALARIVAGMDTRAEATRVAVVTVGGAPRLSVGLNSFGDKAQLVAAIERLGHPGGARNLGHALQFLVSDVLRPDKGSRIQQGVPQMIYVIMGGKSEDDVAVAAGQLRTMGVRVSAFGAGYQDSAALGSIATSGSLVRSWSSFQALLSDSASLTGNAIYLSEEPASIVFVVDASGAVKADELQAVGRFIVSMAHRLSLGAGHARLGVVLYGATPSILVVPGELSSAQQLDAKLAGGLRLVGGATNTGAALAFALNSVMTAESPKTSKSIVLVTWGPSSDDVSAVPALLQQHAVSMLAIGVRGANQGQLDVLASRGGKAFQIASGSLLLQLQGQILTRTLYITSDVTINYINRGTIEMEEYEEGTVINCADVDLNELKNSGFNVACQKNTEVWK
ncbi:unnamed protein product [Lampetra fluviatilis]